MSHMDLRGRAALVTGGSSGIGRAVCLALAARGVRVVAASNEAEELPGVVEEMGGGHGLYVDLTDPAQTAALVGRAEDAAGPLDLLVNNAGIGLQATVLHTSEEALRRVFEVNFFAVALLSREALRRMAERGRGHIINVTSASARRGLPRACAYASSKAAVHGFTQALRIEAWPLGVRVSEVLPISVATPFFDRADNLADRKYKPKGWVQTPEQVADMIVGCAERPRAEVTTSFWAHVALAVQSAFPNVLEPAVRYFSER